MTEKEKLIEMYTEEQNKGLSMFLSEYCCSDEMEASARKTCEENLKNFIEILDKLYDK